MFFKPTTTATHLNAGSALRATTRVTGAVRTFRSTPEPGTPSVSNSTGLYKYQWNLPPHNWSMPVEPTYANEFAVDTAQQVLGSNHKYRRGRIYWYARVDTGYITSNKYNDGSDSKDPRYGFQFLWNPNTFNTSVSINMDITPSFADKFADIAGAFPSGEYLTFTLRIDRTNDFACIKSLIDPTPNINTAVTTYESMAPFYASSSFYSLQSSFDGSNKDGVIKKIIELQKYGTLADIEYLYKAINGPNWVNQATGKKTSDIGFLSPTLLRVDLGPLSYLGYVNSMSVSHLSFSKNMIPLISDVTVQFNLMANAGVSSATKATVTGSA